MTGIERAGAALDHLDRAVEAEAWASAIAGAWHVAAPHGGGEAADVLLDALLLHLARRRTARALAIVEALSAVLPRESAARAADVAAAGCASPAWAPGLGGAEPSGAWLASDVHGDGQSVMVAFRENGGQEHVLLAYVTRTSAGWSRISS